MADLGHWGDIETPAALVDVDRMEANLRSTVGYCRERNLSYRPHAKTHKSSALAREQMEMGAVGITVATPREAEVMATVAEDILVAFPPLGRAKLERFLNLPEGVRLSVALDSSLALRALADAAGKRERNVGVLVEVDVGLKRVGLQSVEKVLELAVEVSELDCVDYRGILLYPGHIRGLWEEQTPAIQELSARLDVLLEALSVAGLRPDIVSGGSTPTLFRSHQVSGVTEVRPGTNIFNDRTTALLNACAWTDCAYTVLATVVSTAIPGQAVVDAGSKALGKEAVNGSFKDPSVATGYGCVLGDPELRVTALSEEHGVIDLRNSNWRPKPGDLVRLIPNHVCVSVNLNQRLWQVQGEKVLGHWTVEARRDR